MYFLNSDALESHFSSPTPNLHAFKYSIVHWDVTPDLTHADFSEWNMGQTQNPQNHKTYAHIQVFTLNNIVSYVKKKVDLHKFADQWEQDGATASFTVAVLYFSLEPIFTSMCLSFKSLS